MRSSFHCRRHFLIRFSRVNASSIGLVEFIEDKIMNAIVFGEAFNRFLLMFIDSAREIAGDADIQRSISLTCEDIDARTFIDHV